MNPARSPRAGLRVAAGATPGSAPESAADPHNPRTGTGYAHGSFGELLQGQVEPGLDFLVTLPIRWRAEACFGTFPGASGLSVEPRHKTKSRRFAALLLAELGLPVHGFLRLNGRLPEGKGLASSSADLVATARAIADHFAVPVPEELMLRCMARIEPSDGVMFDEVVVFAHRQVRLLERLGSVPPLVIVSVDEGGQVDTVAYNRTRGPVGHGEVYRHLLDDLRAALSAGDLAAVGRIATRSAVLNQAQAAKRHLGALIRISEECGALGVVAAHSGTCVGVLLDHADPGFGDRFDRVARRVWRLRSALVVCASTGVRNWKDPR